MKFGKDAGKYLILAETVVLIIVLVLCTIRYLTRPETTLPVEVAEKENDNELSFETVTEETETQENTEVPEMTPVTFSEEVTTALEEMSVEQKVAQIFLTSPESLTGNELVTIARSATRTALTDYPVAGIVYTADNFLGRGQFGALLSGAQRANKEINQSYLLVAEAGNDAQGESRVAISSVYDAAPMVNLLASGTMTGTEEKIIYPVSCPEETEKIQTNTSYVVIKNILDAEASDTIKELRSQLGYQGIVMTTDLSAEQSGAASDGDAAVKAVAAGADLIYQSADFKNVYQRILDAVNDGTISKERLDEAAGRILTIKASMPAPTDGDIITDET